MFLHLGVIVLLKDRSLNMGRGGQVLHLCRLCVWGGGGGEGGGEAMPKGGGVLKRFEVVLTQELKVLGILKGFPTSTKKGRGARSFTATRGGVQTVLGPQFYQFCSPLPPRNWWKVPNIRIPPSFQSLPSSVSCYVQQWTQTYPYNIRKGQATL